MMFFRPKRWPFSPRSCAGRSLPWRRWAGQRSSACAWSRRKPRRGPRDITWLVGGLEHLDDFSIQLGMSSSQLTKSIIFQRGRYTTSQLIIVELGISCCWQERREKQEAFERSLQVRMVQRSWGDISVSVVEICPNGNFMGNMMNDGTNVYQSDLC